MGTEKRITLAYLQRQIKGKNVIIYGTGYVGLRFLEYFGQLEYCSILGFCESNSKDNHRTIHGIPVLSLESVKSIDKHIVIVAVHDVYYGDIQKYLQNMGINEYIYVYPLMINLLLGDPIDEKQVTLCEVIRNIKDFNVPIKVMAIEEMYGLNNIGFDMYLKYIATYNNAETAKKRLDFFVSTVDKINKEGMDTSKPISVDEEYNILDGAHRIAYSCFKRIDALNALVYPRVQSYKEYAGNTYVDDAGRLRELGFTNYEINCLLEKTTVIKRIKCNKPINIS